LKVLSRRVRHDVHSLAKPRRRHQPPIHNKKLLTRPNRPGSKQSPRIEIIPIFTLQCSTLSPPSSPHKHASTDIGHANSGASRNETASLATQQPCAIVVVDTVGGQPPIIELCGTLNSVATCDGWAGKNEHVSRLTVRPARKRRLAMQVPCPSREECALHSHI
jgi:hypothetical protein